MSIASMSHTRAGYYDALLVQVAAIDFYPPTINQANILAEAGLKIAVLDAGSHPRPAVLHPSIELHRPLASTSIESPGRRSLPQRLHANLRFFRALRRYCKTSTLKLRIFYDRHAIALANFVPFSGVTAMHFHEHPEELGEGWFESPRQRLARRAAKEAAFVIVPDQHRATALANEEGLRTSPLVVPNCPRRCDTLPKGKLRAYLGDRIGTDDRIVLFQGSVSLNYYVDQTILSMKWWPDDTVAVFLGPIPARARNTFEELAQRVGVLQRVHFIPPVPYSELFAYTVDADLGLSMIKPSSFNFAHMAGASNKRYEYMACGVPQISNHGPGVDELIEEQGVGICVNPEHPHEIGTAVTRLLSAESLRQKMTRRARELHLSCYNYDYQFNTLSGVFQQICLDH